MRSSLLIIPAAAVLIGLGLSQRLPSQEQVPGQQPAAPISEQLRAENCMVGYIDKVEVPAMAQGKLKSIKIEEGMTIKKDDLIAVIDDTPAQLNLELKKAEEEEAILNATNDINLKDGKNSAKIARAEAESYKELHEKRGTSWWEMQKKILESERAELRVTLAEMQMKIAKAQYFAKRSELRIAEDEIKRRQITAPFDGFIEKREAQLGQWVQPGSPIATLVRMDTLKVEGDIKLEYIDQVARGTAVVVEIFNRGDDEKPIRVNATISYVSTEINMDDRHRVWAEVKNQPIGNENWVIKPGMRAEIIIPRVEGNDNQVF